MGNDPGVIAQVRAAGERTDEPVWELPLVRAHRSHLDIAGTAQAESARRWVQKGPARDER